jgi:hypothetical protein
MTTHPTMSPTGQQLLALAERCEAAEGPDRELDALIHIPECREGQGLRVSGGDVSWLIEGRVRAWGGHIPAYTASLDAAKTLVPEEHVWAVEHAPDGNGAWCYDKEVRFPGPSLATTPALALAAAALKARAAMETQDG